MSMTGLDRKVNCGGHRFLSDYFGYFTQAAYCVIARSQTKKGRKSAIVLKTAIIGATLCFFNKNLRVSIFIGGIHLLNRSA
jgi:hypothetical protein